MPTTRTSITRFLWDVNSFFENFETFRHYYLVRSRFWDVLGYALKGRCHSYTKWLCKCYSRCAFELCTNITVYTLLMLKQT